MSIIYNFSSAVERGVTVINEAEAGTSTDKFCKFYLINLMYDNTDFFCL